MPSSAISALREVLAEEREALLGGRFDALPELADRKTACLDGLVAGDVDEALRESAERNHRLLESSLSALRTARGRVAEIRRMAQGHGGYGADGRARSIACGVPNAGRRV